jgi:hypothetical protein
LGGCLLELPCETDDALQQNFLLSIFSLKKLASGGGGPGGGGRKKFLKKKPKKIFPDKNQLIKDKKIVFGHTRIQLKVKKFFSEKILFKHA